MLLNWSRAVTMMLNGAPAVAELGAEISRCVAVTGPTVIGLDVPLIVEVTVSVAVTVWLPAVFNVAWNTPPPLVSVEFTGSAAAASVLVKCTVPAYPVTRLLNWSNAVTLTLTAVPAGVDGGAVTTKCVAVVELTVIAFEVPVIVAVTVSVPVIVWLPTVFNVAWNDPTPFVSVEFAGNTAAVSVLVKCTVPE